MCCMHIQEGLDIIADFDTHPEDTNRSLNKNFEKSNNLDPIVFEKLNILILYSTLYYS